MESLDFRLTAVTLPIQEYYQGRDTNPPVHPMHQLTLTNEQDHRIFKLNLLCSQISVITLENNVIFTDGNDWKKKQSNPSCIKAELSFKFNTTFCF